MKISRKSILEADEKMIAVPIPYNRIPSQQATNLTRLFVPKYNPDNHRHPVHTGEVNFAEGGEKTLVFMATRRADAAFNQRQHRSYDSEQHRLNIFLGCLNRIGRKTDIAICDNFGLPYELSNAVFEKYIEAIKKHEIQNQMTVTMYQGIIPQV